MDKDFFKCADNTWVDFYKCFENIDKTSVSKLKKIVNDNFDNFSVKQLDRLLEILKNDSRKGVVDYATVLENKLKKKEDEIKRVKKLYTFQKQIAYKPGGSVILGLDEVGRGPLAGPLTVGGVILKDQPYILGLNDSKKLSALQRQSLFNIIENNCIVCKTFSIPPNYIDKKGIVNCLKIAFSEIVTQIENDGIDIDVILLDGNPMHFDNREVNVVKGDGKCASIAAASIVAKVTRDKYMKKISTLYPNYSFELNKGYGTSAHIEAIKKYGLCPIHRKSYCSSFMQLSFI